MSEDERKHRLVLAAMTLANAMILIDQTAVPLALPNIMKEFHVGSQDSQWVLNASLLPLAGASEPRWWRGSCASPPTSHTTSRLRRPLRPRP